MTACDAKFDYYEINISNGLAQLCTKDGRATMWVDKGHVLEYVAEHCGPFECREVER